MKAGVTVGIVTANINSDHAKRCINSVKQFTEYDDLVVLDNNRRGDFNHAEEMNKIIRIADTRYVALLDDDVYVENRWVEEMLKVMTDDVALVSPLHKNGKGELSYAGIDFEDNFSGQHRHRMNIGPRPCYPTPTVCSACLLIDSAKIEYLFFDEFFPKYFNDIDFGLRVWCEGFRVVMSTAVEVVHLGGGTLPQGGADSSFHYGKSMEDFRQKWQGTMWEKKFRASVEQAQLGDKLNG